MKPVNVAANWCLPHFCRHGGCKVFCRANISGERQFAATIRYLHAYALHTRQGPQKCIDWMKLMLLYLTLTQLQVSTFTSGLFLTFFAYEY